MSDHSSHEESAALAAGGLLSGQEQSKFWQHTIVCADCRNAEEEFTELVRLGLPLTVSPLREFLDMVKTRPDKGVRARFLRRAKSEGAVFSPRVQESACHRPKHPRLLVASATVSAAVIIAAAFYGVRNYVQSVSQERAQAELQVEQLRRENFALSARLSKLTRSTATRQREFDSLRTQLRESSNKGGFYRRDDERMRLEAEQAARRNSELLSDLQKQEKLLAQTKSALARINEEDASNQISLAARQTRINELSGQLRATNANLNLERQLAAAGRDVQDLMGARRLHVVDVRDADPTGKASKAFGRVFLTEGKSLIFFAFDLDDAKVASPKRTFEVWGLQEGRRSFVRSLGFLYVDDKTQKRWALKVENPDLVREIDSVFVTVEPAGGGRTPSGRPLLYAYLGDTNHLSNQLRSGDKLSGAMNPRLSCVSCAPAASSSVDCPQRNCDYPGQNHGLIPHGAGGRSKPRR